MAKGELSWFLLRFGGFGNFLFVCLGFLWVPFLFNRKKKNSSLKFLWDCCSSCGSIHCPQKWAQKGPVWFDLYNSWHYCFLCPISDYLWSHISWFWQGPFLPLPFPFSLSSLSLPSLSFLCPYWSRWQVVPGSPMSPTDEHQELDLSSKIKIRSDQQYKMWSNMENNFLAILVGEV